MRDVITDLRAILAGATQLSEDIAGPIEHRTVDRIPVVLIRDAAAEIDRLRAHQPLAGLPAVIATPEDLDTVCSAAGLTRVADTDPDAGPHEWSGENIEVGLARDDEDVWSWTDREDGIGEIEFGVAGSTAVLWAAIRAAREAT